MKILRERRRVTEIEVTHEFEWKDEPGSGYSFPVDPDGNYTGDIPSPGHDNWQEAKAGTIEGLIDKGLRTHTWEITEPRVGECDDCGRKVTLSHFTNTCRCGADYNNFGQRLAPREQWGWDTGESVGDILRIDVPSHAEDEW